MTGPLTQQMFQVNFSPFWLLENEFTNQRLKWSDGKSSLR
jgi:hypothetical protein